MDEASFTKEHELLVKVQSFEHPHLLTLIDVGEQWRNSTTHCLVMPLYDCTLLEYMVHKRSITNVEVRRLFGQVADAIATLHRNRIVHLDIKMENVLIDDSYDAVVVDFGYAEDMCEYTTLSKFCGSPVYMAPELLEKQPYDPFKADVWSLGVLLHLLLTERLPFEPSTDSVDSVFEAVKNQPLVLPPTISPSARELLTGMLDRRPHRRFTMEQVTNHRWLSHPTVSRGSAHNSPRISIKDAFPRRMSVGSP